MSFTQLPPTLPPASQPTAEGGDAAAPDDDNMWRQGSRPSQDAGLDPKVRQDAQLKTCEQHLDRAFAQERPRTIAAAIGDGGCTALKSSGRDCAKCRICPSGEAWEQVSSYYRAQQGTIVVCAEKEPTAREVEDTLTQELVHAYDHCRQGMRVPFVGWQAPWALACAPTACSQVRAYLLGAYQRHGQSSTGIGGGAFGGGGFSNSFGSSGLGGSGSYGDENWSGGGSGYEGGGSLAGDPYAMPDGAAPMLPSQADPEALRDAVYSSALESITSPFAMNACRGRSNSRAVLDAIFNDCVADAAPLVMPPNPSGAKFPPMPAAVDAAEKGVPSPGASAMMPPPPPLPQAGSVPQQKWGEA